jgi:hypothetical protein
MWRISVDDYRETSVIWRGPHPEDGPLRTRRNSQGTIGVHSRWKPERPLPGFPLGRDAQPLLPHD